MERSADRDSFPRAPFSSANAVVGLVRSMGGLRVFQLMLATVFVAGCNSAALRQHATISASDEALFWGRMDAVSVADRRAILTIARERLAASAPSCRVGSVKVFSAREVRVFFGRATDSKAGDMGLERRGTWWQITDEHVP